MAKDKKQAKEKPLEKMTVIELRELGKQIEGVVGVHGMNKPELLAIIKEARGIKEAPKAKETATTKQLKAEIRKLKVQRSQALAEKNGLMATRYRRQISRMKKKTRRAA
ncbi:MAG: transcription termination factor Rho [Desulfobacteraceae bacterium]|nr:MAG: transcription termination factor Rho [Desulfobacteraceae bacterium]